MFARWLRMRTWSTMRRNSPPAVAVSEGGKSDARLKMPRWGAAPKLRPATTCA